MLNSDRFNLQRGRAALLLTCVVLCLDAGFGRAAAAEPEGLQEAREAAVLAARRGDVAAGLARLESLFAEHPDARSVRLDLAVVAGWAGRHARTLELLAALEAASLPDYVLESYARAARERARFDLALELYDRLVARHPDATEFRRGRALVLADAGHTAAARQALETLAESPAVSIARGYVEERAGRLGVALGHYHAALRMQPGHDEAERRRILAAAGLGAARQALAGAQRRPELFGPAELTRLRLDAAAQQLRFAALPNPQAPRADAAAALAAHESLAQTLLPATPDQQLLARTLRFDRVAALVADFRMAEAVGRFEALAAELGTDALPVYVLSAAGQAYLYLERPEAARDAYRAALARRPGDVDVQLGLFYAYSDLGRHRAARTIADQLLAAEPAWLRPGPAIWLANPDYARAAEADALELAYRDRYASALERFDAMLALAPANSSLRLSRAQVRRWRGWTAAAAADADRVLTASPDNARGLAIRGQIALDDGDWAAAEQHAGAVARLAPDAKPSLELLERWRLHNRPAVSVNARAGESEGSAFASRDWQVDSFYYTAPLARRYRAFAHDQVRWARFEEGVGRDHRLGAGIEYRDTTWTGTVAVNRGIEQNDDAGASASLAWRPGDHWTVAAAAAANSAATPLRATRVGIQANQAELALRYRWHEARTAGISAGALDFDDGNLRRWLRLDYGMRVMNLPDHKLRAGLRLYGSANGSADRVYFNPDRDAEIALELAHEWHIFQRYDHGLTQRATVELGEYWQEGFDSDRVWTLSLAHEWAIGPRGTLSYGVQTGGRVYDGDREHMTGVFLGAGWRL